MGSDVWMRPLGPVAAEGAAWLHFRSVAEALRFLQCEAGGSLRHLKHTQVALAAKSDGTRDGYSFTFKEPAPMVVARPARPQPAATPTLASFGLTLCVALVAVRTYVVCDTLAPGVMRLSTRLVWPVSEPRYTASHARVGLAGVH